MAPGNTVTVVGNLVAAPQLKFTSNGTAVASFGVAVNRRWQNRQTQEWEEETSFLDVTCWGQMAENAAESLPKGARVIVTGRLDQETWEKDGEKKSKVKITADEIGPSLRWATAQVVKNERHEGGGHRQQAPPSHSPDEEPFVVPAGEWQPGAWGHYPERMF